MLNEYVESSTLIFLDSNYLFLIHLKAGLNHQIKNMSNVVVKQETAVRWLSLCETMESVSRCYDALRKILLKHGELKRMKFNQTDVKLLIQLLLPFKSFMCTIQTQNISIHMVALSVFKWRKILSSEENIHRFYRENFEKKSKSTQAQLNGNDKTGPEDEDDGQSEESEYFFRESTGKSKKTNVFKFIGFGLDLLSIMF